MLSVQSILVPTDLSKRASRIFDFAANLAEHHQADVHVLHVVPAAGSEPIRALFRRFWEGERASEHVREQITKRIENSLLSRLGKQGAIKRVHRQGAQEADEILRYADEEKVDLIVMGTHGHRSLEHPALGGTSGEVVRRSACPVLTVREQQRDADRPVRRILVPIDFSEPTAEAVQVARELGALFEASLALLFVAEEHTVAQFSDTGLPSFYTLKMDEEITSRADEALRQLFSNAQGPETPVTYHVRRGHPAREVLDVADAEEVDLIVMSTHGQTGHEVFTLGSVTERVVRRASHPVLTLKPFGKSLVEQAPREPV